VPGGNSSCRRSRGASIPRVGTLCPTPLASLREPGGDPQRVGACVGRDNGAGAEKLQRARCCDQRRGPDRPDAAAGFDTSGGSRLGAGAGSQLPRAMRDGLAPQDSRGPGQAPSGHPLLPARGGGAHLDRIHGRVVQRAGTRSARASHRLGPRCGRRASDRPLRHFHPPRREVRLEPSSSRAAALRVSSCGRQTGPRGLHLPRACRNAARRIRTLRRDPKRFGQDLHRPSARTLADRGVAVRVPGKDASSCRPAQTEAV
jgi:hypothetical protein